MAYELTNLLQDVYAELGQLSSHKVTGGSTTTVVDSNLTDYKNKDVEDGVLFVTYDVAGAGAAPEGQFEIIDTFTASSGTFNLRAALTAAVAATDHYAFTTPRYPLYAVIQNVNRALFDLGDLPQVDTTTLDTASNQTEYTQAVAWKRNTFRVDMQGRTNDADDNKWVPIWSWEDVPAAGGTAGKIEMEKQLLSGRDVRIWYWDVHAKVRAYNDDINEYIHPALAKWASVKACLQWMNGQQNGQDRGVLQDLNNAKVEYEMAFRKHPIGQQFKKQGKRNKLFILSAPYKENYKAPDPA